MPFLFAILGLVYGLTQVVLGYMYFEEILDWSPAVLFTLTFALIFLRIGFPFTIGAYFGAVEIWGWPWWGAALFAFPGLIIGGMLLIAMLAEGILSRESLNIGGKFFQSKVDDNYKILPAEPNEKLYEEALAELESGEEDSSIWAKAYAKSLNEEEAKKLYVRFRAEDLQHERNNEYKSESLVIEKLKKSLETSRSYLSLWLFILIIGGVLLVFYEDSVYYSDGFTWAEVLGLFFYALIYSVIKVSWLKRKLKNEITDLKYLEQFISIEKSYEESELSSLDSVKKKSPFGIWGYLLVLTILVIMGAAI
jgi:hypothetical protein